MRKKIDQFLEKILIVLMALMVVDVVWQVFSRYVIRVPSTFTDELAGFLLIWLGLLGAAYASGKGQHLAIEILPNKLGPASRAKLDIFINLMVVLFVIPVMLIGGGHLVYLTFLLEQRSATLGIPLGYIYLCVPLSGLFITIYSFYNVKDKMTTPA
ncbi:TRAP transporter small permease [Fulvivirga sp. M361]|uniref:TRAP transporter small permease n=1 Tax=Fulvivirga sp. M361 TaxID=2594266 RepID=UPI00117A4F78|nr:TRAP transporter small permease [Fulvivirga sp. M361]TRX52065.1 TRAP transporter small permease [Fulvivirga sp. M361]